MNDQPAVLYIEDDPQSRKLMQMLLKGRLKLPNVVILEDSMDFLARVGALDPKPDIIFLDIHVKPYDGFEMLEMLHQFEWFSRTPVVALTASVMNEEVRRLRLAGFSGCLAKPIDLESFPEMLARILEGETIWRIID
jgi:two-component system, NarL family, sensor histidine kinase EvgS